MEETSTVEETRSVERIQFPQAEEQEKELSRLEIERAKHKARAEKFGIEYREPGKRQDLRLDARKERLSRPGFATGIDVFSEEEKKKREQRAERFGLPARGGLEWKPPQVSEDEEKKRQRAERFGVEYKAKDETGLMDVDLFEARRDPGVAVPRRPEAVHVYGVDLLSTRDLLNYFADYGPSFVEWINDSSANILFADAPTAKRAVAGLGQPLPPEDAPEQIGIDTSDPASLEFLWHKGQDFVKQGTPIPLIFRIATVDDVKPAERVTSRRLWLTAGGGRGGGRRGGGGGQQQQRYQQQRGGGGEEGGEEQQQRGRERRRYKARRGGRPAGWQHDDRGEELEGAGGEEGARAGFADGGSGGGGDNNMQPQRKSKARRPRNKRRRGDGDVEMLDAEDFEGGGEDFQHGGAAQRFRPDDDDQRPAFAAVAAAAATTPLAGPPREQVNYGDL